MQKYIWPYASCMSGIFYISMSNGNMSQKIWILNIYLQECLAMRLSFEMMKSLLKNMTICVQKSCN